MPDEPKQLELVAFHVTDVKGLYVPFVGGFIRMVARADLPQAQDALDRGRKAWLN